LAYRLSKDQDKVLSIAWGGASFTRLPAADGFRFQVGFLSGFRHAVADALGKIVQAPTAFLSLTFED
jgi:hypothetical protein